MQSPVSWRRLAPALACAALLVTPSFASASTPADVRVVASNGDVLAEQRQYTGGVQIKTDPNADCFGPGTGGSGDPVRVPGPTALGIVRDAMAFERELRPLSVSDHFDFGLSLCGIGGHESGQQSFWYLKHNHVGAQVGGDQLRLESGDEVVWYLDPDFSDAAPAELALRAPARARPGQPFQVQVVEFADDGSRQPAPGVVVNGATGTTDQNGRTMVQLDQPGTGLLRASRDGAIPSAAHPVCVNDDPSACPSKPGLHIFGSVRRDRIEGSRGDDTINSGAAPDVIDLRTGGADRVRCGGGRDRVLGGDDDDRIARSCERTG
jgi:hypothetical protein